MALAIHRTNAGHRFNEHQPISSLIMKDHVGQFASTMENDAERRQSFLVEDHALVSSVPDIEQTGAGNEAWGKLFNNVPKQLAVMTRRQLQCRTIGTIGDRPLFSG